MVAKGWAWLIFRFQYRYVSNLQTNFPSLGISKGFSIGTASAFSDLSLSYHFTNSNSIIPSEVEKMDRFETALIFGLAIPFNNFEFSPTFVFV